MKKNNKPAAKRYMKTVGMVMASVMVLSSTTGQMVYAESAKDQKDTQDGEKKEEKTIVYLNGKTGNDKNSGESQDEAVILSTCRHLLWQPPGPQEFLVMPLLVLSPAF